jgi:hypothetical protein
LVVSESRKCLVFPFRHHRRLVCWVSVFPFFHPISLHNFFPPGASLGSQNGGLTSLLGLIEVNPLQETFACLLLVAFVVIFLLPILFSLLFYALRIFL